MGILDTVQLPWFSLREDVTADDTLLTTWEWDNSTFEGADISLSRHGTEIGKAGAVAIAFFGKNAANKDAAYKLYGRRSNGPIELLAAGLVTLGARVITKHPLTKVAETAYWVDTITNTVEWIKVFTPLNSADVSADYADKIAYLCGDVVGIKDLMLEVDLDGGAGTAMTELNAIMTGY